MRARASAGAAKLYGNGKTAGEIALENGAQADLMLYGPGNSQPHKVNCGARWIDVHALKAHAGACAGAMGSEGASAQAGASIEAKLYGNGRTAAEIAVQAGFPGAILFGAGNSGLHKVIVNGHLIDVHALQAHAHAGGQISGGTSGLLSAGASGTTQGSQGSKGSSGAQGNGGTGANAGTGGVLGASSTSPGNRSNFASGVLGASSGSGTLPFTGAPLWIAALLAAAFLATGLGLRRAARARA